jgi:diguanylate cyclase (GGDEF)-like protein
VARAVDILVLAVHLRVRLVDADPDTTVALREALTAAGCREVDDDTPPELVIACVPTSDATALHRLNTTIPTAPVLAVCDEADVELVLAEGVAQCVTRPLRHRELVARIRDALKPRSKRLQSRERRLSDAIVALQREKQDLARLVCVDALTGIANRRHAMDLLAAEWGRAAREHMPLALVMIDVDCFHSYNEQYGHLGGDACLQRVVGAMVKCLRRPSDFLGRYGGEEFMAVLPNTDSVGAKIVAERLRAAVEAMALSHAASAAGNVVTITAGFASLRVLADPSDTVDRLIATADVALLRAKASGRNRIGGDAPLVRPALLPAQRWQRYAPVYADPWFADRIPPFLDTVTQETQSVVEAARSGERRGITALQRLRRTAEQIELVALAMLTRDVERAAQDGDVETLRESAEELLQYVTHVQVIYRRQAAANAQVAHTG